jgi:hypothetical protein
MPFAFCFDRIENSICIEEKKDPASTARCAYFHTQMSGFVYLTASSQGQKTGLFYPKFFPLCLSQLVYSGNHPHFRFPVIRT